MVSTCQVHVLWTGELPSQQYPETIRDVDSFGFSGSTCRVPFSILLVTNKV